MEIFLSVCAPSSSDAHTMGERETTQHMAVFYRVNHVWLHPSMLNSQGEGGIGREKRRRDFDKDDDYEEVESVCARNYHVTIHHTGREAR